MHTLLYSFIFILFGTVTAFAQKDMNIPIEGGNLHLRIYGNQPDTLVLINGGPGMNSNGFESVAEQISQWTTVILYDQRGTGTSLIKTLDTNTINMDAMVNDLEHIRTYLQLKSWIVMGHSFGGMLTAMYLKQHPEKVEKAIFSSSGGLDLTLLNGYSIFDHLTTVQADSFRYFSDLIAAGDTSFNIAFQRAKILAPVYLHHADKVNEVATRLTQVNRTINQLLWADMRCINFDCKKAAAEFTAPVLILQGKNDLLPLHIALTADSLFQDATLVLLNDCSHYGWLDQPEKYLSSLEKFIKN